MERTDRTTAVVVLATPQFEERDVAVVELEGEHLWSARQVASALDYERPDQLVTNITSVWSDELLEGTDYLVVRGDELAALKAVAPGLVDARAPSLLMLTESGVHLVALLSRQPAAVRLRRWLATEVLPALRRSGTYTLPGRAIQPVALPAPSALPEVLRAAPAGALLELLHAEAALGHELPELRAMLARGPQILALRSALAQRERLRVSLLLELKPLAEVVKELDWGQERNFTADEWARRIGTLQRFLTRTCNQIVKQGNTDPETHRELSALVELVKAISRGDMDLEDEDQVGGAP